MKEYKKEMIKKALIILGAVVVVVAIIAVVRVRSAEAWAVMPLSMDLKSVESIVFEADHGHYKVDIPHDESVKLLESLKTLKYKEIKDPGFCTYCALLYDFKFKNKDLSESEMWICSYESESYLFINNACYRMKGFKEEDYYYVFAEEKARVDAEEERIEDRESALSLLLPEDVLTELLKLPEIQEFLPTATISDVESYFLGFSGKDTPEMRIFTDKCSDEWLEHVISNYDEFLEKIDLPDEEKHYVFKILMAYGIRRGMDVSPVVGGGKKS